MLQCRRTAAMTWPITCTWSAYLLRERALIQAVVAEWSRGEQQRIYEEMPENSYGWFHHVTVPAFNGMAARWRIDTSCRGVQWHSIEALRQWFAGVPNLPIRELVLGFERVE